MTFKFLGRFSTEPQALGRYQTNTGVLVLRQGQAGTSKFMVAFQLTLKRPRLRISMWR